MTSLSLSLSLSLARSLHTWEHLTRTRTHAWEQAMEAMDAFAVEVSYLSDAEKKKKVSFPTHASTRAQTMRLGKRTERHGVGHLLMS